MNRPWETGCAWLALVLGVALAAVVAVWPEEPWLRALSPFWCLAFGCSGFFGFACFRIWPDDDPGDEKRKERRTWLIYQYALNAFGSIVGWVVLRALIDRVGERTIDGIDFLLAAIAFIGLVGWLPFTVLGVAKGLTDLAKKALGVEKK
jgi:hypothetical protein